ncbi:hypothetical protein [Streptomyces sp. 020-2-3H-GM]|uniref:hypothetical protein n=1 Tax=Streptomyces sp. 020-2-3H-GM TaxID=2789258 RepID=UPI0039802072
MTELPEEDQPSGKGLIPADDDVAMADAGDLMDPLNPMSTAVAFVNALRADDGPNLELLKVAVTPESWPAWGDFSEVVEMVGDRGLATQPDAPASGEPDVRYVKLVALDDPGQSVMSDGYTLVPAQIITLQFRPSSGYWRVHGVGDYLRPEELPPAT